MVPPVSVAYSVELLTHGGSAPVMTSRSPAVIENSSYIIAGSRAGEQETENATPMLGRIPFVGKKDFPHSLYKKCGATRRSAGEISRSERFQFGNRELKGMKALCGVNCPG
ncbi:MAG: hypothetical protein ACI9R3_001072 [Verrucomicrobiales bacterium]|jgi:hypothetical protein